MQRCKCTRAANTCLLLSVSMSTSFRKRSAPTSLASVTACKRRRGAAPRQSRASPGFSALPRDCLQRCLSFLDSRDQCRVSQVDTSVLNTCRSSKPFSALMSLVRAARSKSVVDPSQWVHALNLPVVRGEKGLGLLSSVLSRATIVAHSDSVSNPSAQERAAKVKQVVCKHLEKRPKLKEKFFFFRKEILCSNAESWKKKSQFERVLKFLFGKDELLKLACSVFLSDFNELALALLRSTHRSVYKQALRFHKRAAQLNEHEVQRLDSAACEICHNLDVLYEQKSK